MEEENTNAKTRVGFCFLFFFFLTIKTNQVISNWYKIAAYVFTFFFSLLAAKKLREKASLKENKIRLTSSIISPNQSPELCFLQAADAQICYAASIQTHFVTSEQRGKVSF